MKNVLIVEDDEIIAWEVAKHLSLWQMNCTVVEDFQRVIETFNECEPDIVLMDEPWFSRAFCILAEGFFHI